MGAELEERGGDRSQNSSRKRGKELLMNENGVWAMGKELLEPSGWERQPADAACCLIIIKNLTITE